MRSDLWHECSGYWQNSFIRENVLALGHAAWLGFSTQGRGMVVCEVAIATAISTDSTLGGYDDVVEYTTRFVPKQQIPAYLHALKLDTGLITRLMTTVQTYIPTQDILLLIQENGRADINLLQNLRISPVECYQQMQRRWVEFQLDPEK